MRKLLLLWGIAAAIAVGHAAGRAAEETLPFNGMGERVGEVTDRSALVHVRLTSSDRPDETLDFPGREGVARVHYGLQQPTDRVTPWRRAAAATDFAFTQPLSRLRPDALYHYRVEMARRPGGAARFGAFGQFRTAPVKETWSEVTFTVITGQKMLTRDDPGGFKTYRSMLGVRPRFFVHTGDNVYYDNDMPPEGRDIATARQHWHRMYGLPNLVAFFRQVPAYWEKDDHDYRHNDCDRHSKLMRRPAPGEAPIAVPCLTHEEGVRVFHEVVPVGRPSYRTFRWGKGLQIWLVEGRDYRGDNHLPDGPGKTIWGEEQKRWLKRTLQASDATFKVLISPTPIVGPDRQTKRDNHANRDGFWTEGREFLRWVKESGLKNFAIVCGDRHWQYHSIDETGAQEFSAGPVSDAHAVRTEAQAPRWPPDRQPFYRLAGGFLAVTASPDAGGKIRFHFHDVDGKEVYAHEASAR